MTLLIAPKGQNDLVDLTDEILLRTARNDNLSLPVTLAQRRKRQLDVLTR